MHGGARLGAGRKPANFDHDRARKLRGQGITYAEIADRFGVTVDAIKWFFKKEKQQYSAGHKAENRCKIHDDALQLLWTGLTPSQRNNQT